MKVTLLNYTSDALDLLLTTKGTRLAHADDPATWSEAKKAEHLAYMRNTIKSSWEFVDYVFKIEGVTRAFTHQLVRTRTGSYAQESMRSVDASQHEVEKPDLVDGAKSADHAVHRSMEWDGAVFHVMTAYQNLLHMGVAPQDARGLLPTNVTTSIIAKFDLRTLANMAELRLCTRTQGEYQDVFREMRRLVIEVHPWAEEFINVYCANHGTCAFPTYGEKECVWYRFTMDKQARIAAKNLSQVFWMDDAPRQEAHPKVKEGKAM